jgi:hypothetical protein
MAYIFTVIFISKLVSVEMACLLVIQNEIQAVWTLMVDKKEEGFSRNIIWPNYFSVLQL